MALQAAVADNYEEEGKMDVAAAKKQAKAAAAGGSYTDSSEYQQHQPPAGTIQHYIDHDYSIFYTKNINLTSVLNKQIRLPCMVERGRKFIWMKADRNEILTIDNMLITGDRRFSIEHSAECYDKAVKTDNSNTAGSSSSSSNTIRKTNKGLSVQSRHTNVENNNNNPNGIRVENVGCWVYLCIENVHMSDEGLYVCQIDTMSSTRISVNILGKNTAE
jgi:hypothetical protein